VEQYQATGYRAPSLLRTPAAPPGRALSPRQQHPHLLTWFRERMGHWRGDFPNADRIGDRTLLAKPQRRAA
jgi:hypothetical protein